MSLNLQKLLSQKKSHLLLHFLPQGLNSFLQQLLATLKLIDSQIHLTDGRHTALSCLTKLYQLDTREVNVQCCTEKRALLCMCCYPASHQPFLLHGARRWRVSLSGAAAARDKVWSHRDRYERRKSAAPEMRAESGPREESSDTQPSTRQPSPVTRRWLNTKIRGTTTNNNILLPWGTHLNQFDYHKRLLEWNSPTAQ